MQSERERQREPETQQEVLSERDIVRKINEEDK